MTEFRSFRAWLAGRFGNRSEAIKQGHINAAKIDQRKWSRLQTSFVQLNSGWNAHPVDPNATIAIEHNLLRLEIDCVFDDQNLDRGTQRFAISFPSCWRYRLSGTNDEGWYDGQCRFSGVAPQWGEFYEVKGDLRLDCPVLSWTAVADGPAKDSRHFLFYFKDETFECDALGWNREPVSRFEASQD
ncbi:hypothetical protein Pla108_29090 [Botrimarina colliarenosi]|uniref:Uncharacterized protein n=1 Tax=Botrimarina colliarenosi TaxID=2528001 RepID=A0A5C6A760_9BACT|nr:hypothetical protein [Botrimarina colliarenosi]TWT95832.1 hypothetical protein Pla108_29090 [Botrimarina colliarenosi]